jgi:transposase
VLAEKQPGEKIGRLTAEQAEIARLRRQLEKAERRLATTEAALGIMGRQPLRLAVRLNSGCETSM